MKEPITCKRQFYREWNLGLLGNKPKTWPNKEEYFASKFNGLVALRYAGFGGGGPMIIDLRRQDVLRAFKGLTTNGWCESDFHISELISPKIYQYVINGEVTLQSEHEFGSLCLFYSLENTLMRPALSASGKQVYGISAVRILRDYLTRLDDYDLLMQLLNDYPDHTIEFSGFRECVGIFSRSNMIVWEVRRY